MKNISVILILAGIVCMGASVNGCSASAKSAQDELDRAQYAKVPLVRLLANPRKFNGCKILTEGVLQFALSDSVLYASKEWYKAGVTTNAVALRLDVKAKNIANYEQWTGKYVVVQGVFDAADCGDACAYSGAIKNITYIRVVQQYSTAR